MPKSIVVKLEPSVLKWLRQSAGLTPEDVAKRLKVTPEVVLDFESGKRSPTLSQIKVLSTLINRPIAAFFLSAPRYEKPLPKDFRFLPIKKDIFDNKTTLVIRKVRNLQEISRELALNMNYKTNAKIDRVRLSDNAEAISSKYRELFKLDLEKQKQLKDAYKLFNYLRGLIEGLNILVFQFSMPIEDARGFALSDEHPAVIVVNSRDGIEARLFSLMHEFAHVLLGDTVIDMPGASITLRDSIEGWCNAFAASFLLPTKEAKEIFDQKRDKLLDSETLNILSRRYKVSKAALLYKMLNLHYLSKPEVEGVLDRYSSVSTSKKTKTKTKTGIPGDKKCLSEMGNRFVSLVANNYDQRLITYTDALSYLSIKSRNFDKVLARAKG